MNRWYIGLFALLIIGCGGNSNSDSFGGRAEELDGGSAATNDYFSVEKDRKTLRSTPLVHEFNVDLFSSDPLQQVTDLTISSADTFKISLQTLDLLPEEKRFPLIQADKIVQNGMPKVIAPIGYEVILEVQDTQVVAIIKSTTSPEKSVQPVPIYTGNNDIVVGDLAAQSLLFASIHSGLSSANPHAEGMATSVTAFNRSVTYNLEDRWSLQWYKRKVGNDATVNLQIGKDFNVFDRGTLQFSAQYLYGERGGHHSNAVSLKYSTSKEKFDVQGHIIASTTLSLSPQSALGMGCSFSPSEHTVWIGGVAVSRFEWNASIDFRLEF